MIHVPRCSIVRGDVCLRSRTECWLDVLLWSMYVCTYVKTDTDNVDCVTCLVHPVGFTVGVRQQFCSRPNLNRDTART